MGNSIRLVVADVDGTLVTQEKVLTARAIEVVKRLRNAGIAFTITSGSGAGLRFTALAALALAGARLLWSSDPPVQLTAVGVLALAAAMASAIGASSPDLWPYAAAAFVAASVAWLPARTPSAG